MIRSVSAKGAYVTVRFGTNDVRDLSDGQFPVEVWRVDALSNGNLEATWLHTCRKSTTVRRAVRDAGRGWSSRADTSWVEIRTHRSRLETP